jgi:hypothetical protein
VASNDYNNQKFVQVEAEIVVEEEVVDRVTKTANLLVNGFIDEQT